MRGGARVGRFARTRNGALRRSRKPASAGHESVQAARRNTKALRPVLEEKEQEGERSKRKEGVRRKCGGQRLVVFRLPTQQKTNLPHLLPTPYYLLLSLHPQLPAPYYLLLILWRAKRVCVLCGKSQQWDRRKMACVCGGGYLEIREVRGLNTGTQTAKAESCSPAQVPFRR